MADNQIEGRSWLTAKGYRYLGHPIPDDIPDDEVIVFATAPPPRPAAADLVAA